MKPKRTVVLAKVVNDEISEVLFDLVKVREVSGAPDERVFAHGVEAHNVGEACKAAIRRQCVARHHNTARILHSEHRCSG